MPALVCGFGAAVLAGSVLGATPPPSSSFVHEAVLQGRVDPAVRPNAFFGNSVAVSGDTAVVGAPFDGFSGAAYVFVRSGTTWVPQGRLAPFDGGGGDGFGFSVSVSGDTILVGSRFDDTAQGEDTGSAYVFVRTGSYWSQQQKFEPADGVFAGSFGIAVSIDGNTALVGATEGLSSGGAAYVFVRSGTSWALQQRLVAADGALGDLLGISVAVSGDTALLGAPRAEDATQVETGAAYVFLRSGTTWTEQQKLLGSQGAGGHYFGWGVSLSGDTAAVGSPGSAGVGAAYVFVRDGTGWTEQQRLQGDGTAGESVGDEVAVSGDTLLLEAFDSDTAAGVDAGAAYVFVRSGTAWSQQQKLTASDGSAHDAFGFSLAVSGDRAVLGAIHGDAPGGVDAGSAYVFTRAGTSWTEEQRLAAADSVARDFFGESVALSGDIAVVGAYQDDLPGLTDAGSAYVFVRLGSAWTKEPKLTAPDAAHHDRFGWRVSLSGDTLVVGSPRDDTAAGADAGSAYVFVRSGTTWSLQQKLTAADGAPQAFFGQSVSIDGDTVVVGAYRAGPPAGAGAAYVFVRAGTTWSEQQKLLATQGEPGDAFGWAVSISGETVAVGAYNDSTPAGANAGSVYVFVRTGATWTEQQRVEPEDASAAGVFGEAVRLAGDTLAVGAPFFDFTNFYTGAAYVFTRTGTLWTQQQKFLPPEPRSYLLFGNDVAVSADTLVIGAPDIFSGSGAAHVYARAGTSWTPRQVLGAPGGELGDFFGLSLSLSGDTLVAGASGDDTPDGLNAGSAHVFRLRDSADLHVLKTGSPEPVLTGSTLTYTIGVFNTGPDTSGAVTLVDTLPAGVTFQNVSGSGWACAEAAGVVTCTRPPLPLGAAPDVVIVATAPGTPGSITNTATLTHTQMDPDPSNNSASWTSTVSATSTADLNLVKTTDGSEARWGQPFSWTIVAGNIGPDAANAAMVADTFPPEITGVTWTCVASAGSSCPASGSGNISAAVDLLAGGSATFTATGTVQPGAAGLSNLATIAVPAGVNDPNPANNGSATFTFAGPIRYYTLPACRVLDTRPTASPLDANSVRSFAVAGECGVPADARAVALNVIAVNPGDQGNLRLYPTGQEMPLASTLNFAAGRTRANNAVIPLGAAGQLDVRCDMPAGSSATTHFVADVYGYFR